jgi:hypothetical protein
LRDVQVVDQYQVIFPVSRDQQRTGPVGDHQMLGAEYVEVTAPAQMGAERPERLLADAGSQVVGRHSGTPDRDRGTMLHKLPGLGTRVDQLAIPPRPLKSASPPHFVRPIFPA